MTAAEMKGKVVVLYGCGSRCGKTTLAESLLQALPGWGAIKISPSKLYSTIAVADLSADPPNKDTSRLARAGAEPVIYVSSPREDLGEALSQAMEFFSPGQSVLIEGRGALDHLKADLTIFVWQEGLENSKGSIKELAEGADLIYVNVDKSGAATRDPDHADEPLFLKGRFCSASLEEVLQGDSLEEILAFLREKGIL